MATAPGRGGIGIVRISGPRALAVGEGLTGRKLAPHRTQLTVFCDNQGVIDQGIALYFPEPGSFTGEAVVELQGHGGPTVMRMLLEAALAGGARLARPGEFTERAFLNGKLDLAQAEAVSDLIASASTAAARAAQRALSGAFSREIAELDQDLLKLRAFVEAAMDFPDEETGFFDEAEVGNRTGALIEAVRRLQGRGRQGALLAQGISVAITGAPNAGKSSLLNQLSGEDAAIVSHLPGTTRDLLKVDLTLDGLPVRLVDTAGIRPSKDPVEQEGVRRARAAVAEADLVIEVRDSTTNAGRDTGSSGDILVLNKIDLSGQEPGVETQNADVEPAVVRASCLTGAGISDLKRLIQARVGFSADADGFSARQRHLQALEAVIKALESARTGIVERVTGELVAEDLRAAHLALGEITGAVTPDGLLGEIFSSFCIGK